MECFINLPLSSSRPFLGWLSRRLDYRSLGISAMKEPDEVYNPDDVIEVDDDFDFDTLISKTFDHGRENPKDDILEPPSLANVMQKMKDQHEAEVMKLRERIDELEIEKVQTDIDKMEMEAEIKDLETKVCKCSKIFVNEGENYHPDFIFRMRKLLTDKQVRVQITRRYTKRYARFHEKKY